MSLTMWIYLIDVASALSTSVSWIAFLACAMSGLFYIFFLTDASEEEKPLMLRNSKKCLIVFCCFAPISIFIPSKSTMHAMLAAEAATEVLKHPEVQKIGGRALEILNKKLDEMEKKGE
jgi:hypothetical protein